MIENNPSLIDSNILIYSIDSSEKVKHSVAKKLLMKCWTGKTRYAVSLQNLSEFFVNVTQRVAKPVSKEKGAKIVKKMLEFKGFIKFEPTQETIKKALDIVTKENTEYWDSLIAATMLENNVFHIYTENTSDFKIGGITAINPFEKRKEKNKGSKTLSS